MLCSYSKITLGFTPISYRLPQPSPIGLTHYPPPSPHEYLTHIHPFDNADTCADLIILILELLLNAPELRKSRGGQGGAGRRKATECSAVDENIVKTMTRHCHVSSLLLSFLWKSVTHTLKHPLSEGGGPVALHTLKSTPERDRKCAVGAEAVQPGGGSH